jgi:hypothetical protein
VYIDLHGLRDKMFLILSLIIVVLLLVYIKLKYFTLRGPIPGLPPQLLFGNLIQTGFTRGVSYFEIFSSLRKRFGHVYQIWLGHVRFIVVCDVKDIQHIFTNRNIYDQGPVFIEKVAVILPGALMAAKGYYYDQN